MSKIIFKNKDNTIGIVTPTEQAVKLCANLGIYNTDKVLIGFKELTDDEFLEAEKEALPIIAKKDVPSGSPYKIVEDTKIPTDRTFRNAWVWDDTIKPDGYGGESNSFSEEILAKVKEA